MEFGKMSILPDESEEEISDLEKEFREFVPNILAQIEYKIAIAHEALEQAIKLSEEHGIPFYSGISELGQGYTPDSWIKSKFKKLSDSDSGYDTLHDIFGFNPNSYGRGWQNSMIC